MRLGMVQVQVALVMMLMRQIQYGNCRAMCQSFPVMRLGMVQVQVALVALVMMLMRQIQYGNCR